MTDPSCARCGHQSCREDPAEAHYPPACPMVSAAPVLEAARVRAAAPETRRLAAAAARTESDGYGRDTRVEETMAFARRIGADHIGVAFCVGLMREARMLVDILEHQGFRCSSVCCKAGAVPKEALGLEDHEKLRPGRHESACHPVGQAAVLAEAGTQLNVVLGLCVGHDSLFFQRSRAPVTVLVAKDRVLAHNPVGALYTSHSYYRRTKGG
jgi:uncharacterized metal-binding protein